MPFIFKSSFDKANRTSINSPRGVGMGEGLRILNKIRDTLDVPVITDIHEPWQAQEVSHSVDVLQIPAFLSRQTDLLIAAAQTKLPVNIKKGQFAAPWDMQAVINKFVESGNDDIMLCERGTSFGYNTLVNDMRALPIMAKMGYPVIFDATHSVQQPGGLGTATGGQRDMVTPLARAAVAVGVAGVFLEVHDDPDNAPSDGANMLRLSDLAGLLEQLQKIDSLKG